MAYIKKVMKDAIIVRYIKRPLVLVPTGKRVYIKHEQGNVCIYYEDSKVTINTVTAVALLLKIGQLVKELPQDAIIQLSINGKNLDMLPDLAMKVAGAIFKRADSADDYQLTQTRRVSQ